MPDITTTHTTAAGVMFVTPDGKVLLLKRTAEGDHDGEWAFPGGKLEDGEDAEAAARRECQEEIGREPDGPMHEWTRRVKDGVDFTTYISLVDEPFEVQLNEEHSAADWVEVPGMKLVAARAKPKADARADKDFTESEHPRGQPENAGQFTDKGAGGTTAAAKGNTTKATAHLVSAHPDRTQWPSHIQKLKLPPAWQDVWISPDPKAPLQATGRDSKNRRQPAYLPAFRESQTAKKFTRIEKLERQFDRVSTQNQKNMKARDPLTREHAAVTTMILEMGLRPGSERETGAEEQAYGATTLRDEHVLTDGQNTWLKFTGKKGVKLMLPVDNRELATSLKERAKKGGQLFPEVSDRSLHKYVSSLGAGGFHTKDLRTLKGTKLARNLVEKLPAPTSESAYKKSVKSVATEVAKVLGNTPAVCLSAYISPVVFAGWKQSAAGTSARHDAEWDESKHPRGQPGNAGQFGPGGGGGSTGEPADEKKPEPAKTIDKRLVALKARRTGETVKLQPKEVQQERSFGVYEHLGMLAGHYAKNLPEGTESPASFIQKNGQPFVANEKTYAGPRGPMKMCYMNATQEALHNPDRIYVEGYITVHGVPIQHAWTMDESGQIYDPTINPHEAIGGYFGVPFTTEYLLKATLENKVYGLLGYASKSLPSLLQGKESRFKVKEDVDTISDDHLINRMDFAEKVIRSIPSTEDIDTPERHELRKQITEDLYNKDIDKRSRNREATIILGLPGAGKSNVAGPLLEKGALEVDPDLAKAKLPEFQGGVGAFATHEESSSITREVLRRAVENGDDFVWPRIDSPDKIKRDIESLKKAGYKVHVKLMKVSLDTATHSAVSRFLRTGRYVSPRVVESYGDSPDESYRVAKELSDTAEVYYREREGGFVKMDEDPGSDGKREVLPRAA